MVAVARCQEFSWRVRVRSAEIGNSFQKQDILIDYCKEKHKRPGMLSVKTESTVSQLLSTSI